MNKLYWLIFVFLWIGLGTSVLKAQVPPPDLICVFNQADGTDTLRWNIPVVNCGAINAFEIYQSTDQQGPYTLVQTVMDPMATEAVITNTSNRTFYYYVQIDADCPGETPLQSDTLSNLLPPGISITRVSVENGDVLIEWEDLSDSLSKIAGYVIYRVGVGTIPIDTVYGSISTYIDRAANPGFQPEIYFVQAIDGCGLTGPIGSNPHQTIFLEDSLSVCARTLYFDYTRYRGWDSIAFHELRVSINNGPFVSVDTISSENFNARLPNLDARNNYRVVIRAKKFGSDIFSNSNAIDITPDISQGIQNLNLWGVSLDTSGGTALWNWNNDAALTEATLIVEPDGNQRALDLQSFIDPLSTINEYSFNERFGQNGPIRMVIRTLDECDSTVLSDTVQTAYVSAIALNSFTNRVALSYPLVGENVEISSCELLRLKRGRVDRRYDLMDTVDVLDDEFEGTDETNSRLCYQMVCRAEASLPDGTFENFTLRSNISCPVQEVRIQVPNAIRPEGSNPFFRPIFLFESSIAQYSMKIFDRWGQLLFETDNPGQAWDGTSNGEPLPKGVYVYQIGILQRDGTESEYQGTVLLLR